MLFRIGERELANAIFYNSSLDAEGSGTKEEAIAQARVMLAGESLLKACRRVIERRPIGGAAEDVRLTADDLELVKFAIKDATE